MVRYSTTLAHLDIFDLEIDLELSKKLTLTLDDKTLLQGNAKGEADANSPETPQTESKNIDVDVGPTLEQESEEKSAEKVSTRKTHEDNESQESPENTVVKMTFVNKVKSPEEEYALQTILLNEVDFIRLLNQEDTSAEPIAKQFGLLTKDKTLHPAISNQFGDILDTKWAVIHEAKPNPHGDKNLENAMYGKEVFETPIKEKEKLYKGCFSKLTFLRFEVSSSPESSSCSDFLHYIKSKNTSTLTD